MLLKLESPHQGNREVPCFLQRVLSERRELPAPTHSQVCFLVFAFPHTPNYHFRYKNPEREKQNPRAMVVSQLRATEATAGLSQEDAAREREQPTETETLPPREDANLEIGAAVHIAPNKDAGEGTFLRLGGVGIVVAPGEEHGKWHVETREQGNVWVESRFLNVALKRGDAPTKQEQLESTFAVPLSVYNMGNPQLSPDRAEVLQKLVSEKLSDPVFTEAMASRPCNHNNWDNVRIVKGKIGLRCRSCGIHWKADVSAIIKCPAFFNGYCPNGVSCPLPHIHRYKNKAKEEAKARIVALTLQQAAQAAQSGMLHTVKKNTFEYHIHATPRHSHTGKEGTYEGPNLVSQDALNRASTGESVCARHCMATPHLHYSTTKNRQLLQRTKVHLGRQARRVSTTSGLKPRYDCEAHYNPPPHHTTPLRTRPIP